MNENTTVNDLMVHDINAPNSLHKDSTALHPFDLGKGSHADFPPLAWVNNIGASSSASGEDILKKILEANGSAIIPNTDVGNQNNLKAPGKGTRVPYANLFKSNRRARSDFKLQKVNVSATVPEFGIDQIDSVEKTYGICLLGYVISGKPPSASLFDLVKRWGTNIQFQTHESDWIIFTFPSVEVKNRILERGSYMVYGYHLFLKEMPTCFWFREEDIISLPSWIQIHGIPPDCWNHHVLSTLASYVGTPVHMDMLTHDRKRVKYARVLVEVDISKPKLSEMDIILPIGKVKVNFEYEHEFKPCEHCLKPGHVKENCFALKKKQSGGKDLRESVPKRGRSKSVFGRNNGNINKPRATSTPGRELQGNIPLVAEMCDAPVDVGGASSSRCNPLISNETPKNTETLGGIDKGKKVVECNLPIFQDPLNTYNDDEEIQLNGNKETKVVPGEGSLKNKKKKEKKKNKKKAENESGGLDEKMKAFFENLEDESSCDTEYIKGDGNDKKQIFNGNEEKGRHPKSASGL